MALATTINTDGILRGLTIMLVSGILAGCGVQASPPCPEARMAQSYAPSAGCLALQDGKLLVVQDRRGKLSPPGGSAQDGESAQCTAFRETWEETGLVLEPAELLAVFETGFHLYFCEHHVASGEIDPPERFEVRDAFYLAPNDFEQWEWRFPGQEQALKSLTETALNTDLSAPAE